MRYAPQVLEHCCPRSAVDPGPYARDDEMRREHSFGSRSPDFHVASRIKTNLGRLRRTDQARFDIMSVVTGCQARINPGSSHTFHEARRMAAELQEDFRVHIP